MAGMKRKHSLNQGRINQNNEARRIPTAGKKPLPEPTSVRNVFLMILMHICRKIVLFEPEIKVGFYLVALLCGSLISDFVPMPRSYFSKKGNIFNQYFVKLGWGWTLIFVGCFLGFTTWVYCCGKMDLIRKHFIRLGVGTFMWFTWTKSFAALEFYTAGCMMPKHITKIACLQAGQVWKGFDISGHAFLLIYCSLLIAEEAKSIRGWERISDLIRNEGYDEESPLKVLSIEELNHLKENYSKWTPYVRSAFVGLTLLMVLWDVMLVCTIMYFHSMVQKIVGGSIAILMWYMTYRWMYKQVPSLCSPGEGLFKYSDQPMLRRS